MITLTVKKQVKKGKVIEVKREIQKYHSMDEARKAIVPIVKIMKTAKASKVEPTEEIVGVSYDTKSEKMLLLELDAIKSVENEHDDMY